ncbi:MAG: biopolymer transporter ExbD [Elainellaceae cyanobacterium]
MKLYTDNPDTDVRIELVPLIDVIFCILTFFILAAVTLTRQTAINVDLPRAGTGATQLRELLIVSVDPIGQTYIEKQPVTREQLYEAMINFRGNSPDGLVVLYASRAASYNDVVQVLDLLRSVGGSRVALATLPGNASDSNQFQLPNSPLDGNPANSADPYQLPNLPDSLDLDTPLPGLEPLPSPSSNSPSSSGNASGSSNNN